MPAVVGLGQKEALRRFAGIRITVYVYPERNPKIAKGIVFHQTPGPGPVAKGALSALYVSSGPHGPRVGRPFVAHR
jgi:beta-lactam-binding protein with PASTA domain